MPTYEYKCDACGNEFERFQSITAAPIKKCRKKKVRRLLSGGAGLIFKGSGFYITDYRDSSYKDKAKADAPSSGDSKKTETKAAGDSKSAGESKPAAEAKPAAESKPASAS